MLAQLRRSFALAVFCLVFFGFVYALAGTGIAQLFFAHQADGSITANGSTLIGQNWKGHEWFHGRPDDTGPYAATAKAHRSGGDNPLTATGTSGLSAATSLGPRSKVLVTNTKALVAYWHRMGVPDPTPDLVTTSGSGLDPDIKPTDALVQVSMVSEATGVSPARLRTLIAQETHGRQFGFLSSSYIVVLTLNEGLAKLDGR